MIANSDIIILLSFFLLIPGGSANSIAMRVRQLYQNDLPERYQRGSCAMGDLQEHTTAAGFISNPCALLISLMLLLSIFILLN